MASAARGNWGCVSPTQSFLNIESSVKRYKVWDFLPSHPSGSGDVDEGSNEAKQAMNG